MIQKMELTLSCWMKYLALTWNHSYLSTKILQWHLGPNLQCKGVVPITTKIEGSRVCLEYHIFYKPSPTFVLIGVPLPTLLRGADEGGHLKLAIEHKEFSTNSHIPSTIRSRRNYKRTLFNE
jgi:hypothetical protein